MFKSGTSKTLYQVFICITKYKILFYRKEARHSVQTFPGVLGKGVKFACDNIFARNAFCTNDIHYWKTKRPYQPYYCNRVFHKRTEMPKSEFSSLLCENKKKSSDKMLPPVGIEPRPLIASSSRSNTLLPTLT